MDRISGLSDDVLVKILSFVPTKEAVATSILSKRWEFLWMWLPKLEFISEYVESKQEKPGLCDFLNKKLSLHRAPVLESLGLELCCNPRIKHEDIKWWIKIAVSRHVRELKVILYPNDESIFPCSFFTCKSLVTLILRETSLLDVPRMVCLPSLKAFRLEGAITFDGDSFQRLLSNCPILEDLWVEEYEPYSKRNLSVITQSLRRLTLIYAYDSLVSII